MRTFKDLQEATLRYTGDEADTSTMLDLVKDRLKYAHKAVLTEQMYDFMLWPRIETLAVEAGRKQYALHPLYGQGLWFYNSTTDEWMEEVPAAGVYELNINPYDQTAGLAQRFHINSVMPVKRQPPTAGSVITVTTTGGTEASANSVTIKGIDSNGDYVEEDIGGGTTWTTDTTSATFTTITGVVKNGTTWTRTITLTDADTNTLLQLRSDERGRQYRQWELLIEPSTAATVAYRFYQKPATLEDDYDLVQVPEEFDQLVVYKALIALQGYIRPTAQELAQWQQEAASLELNMRAAYTQARTLNGRASYVNYEPR